MSKVIIYISHFSYKFIFDYMAHLLLQKGRILFSLSPQKMQETQNKKGNIRANRWINSIYWGWSSKL